MDILKRITEYRIKKNWSEYELAKFSDLPQSTISSWYKKGMLPSISSLEKICKGLNITLSQFFCDGEDSIVLTEKQKELIEKYNALSDSQKEKLDIFIDGMLSR
ncbi:helix-turn-helix domain-containing protein [Candidatus Soleaferrea massiliensis]|uniref:helix-turn-helix domain-containing protein n=1 Tax=Candidatus Soleaferrea massiliensis TaxID=1470354 RepID=UPI00058BF140|nr:helix-turn-helix domain-containing protein [Candidatus Soleaferrea massiliensis]